MDFLKKKMKELMDDDDKKPAGMCICCINVKHNTNFSRFSWRSRRCWSW